ncbi:MAG: insulinase family protein, partial [Simkania negevensis]|nr:insulinase family protein [Simkania negevensis]
NEMKGSLSSPDNRLWHAMLEHLLPDLPYKYNAGGDPKEIPDLTYKKLKEFHSTYYHPSRALFFFYGNLPLEKHLNFLVKHALQGIKKEKPLPSLSKQKRFSKPKTLLLSYPLHEKEKKEKTIIAFGYLTTELNNQEEVLALTVLDSLLMETDACPLKFDLLQSELCRQADGHMELDMTEIPYVIVCHGCEEKNREKLQEVLLQSLKKIAKEGFEKKRIDAALHQIEFSRLEITGDYGPFGLTLFMRSALAKQHGSAPEHALRIYSQFETLQKKLQDPSYLPSLIHKYFIDNPHFVALTMRPDETLEEKEQEEEKQTLEKIKAKLSFKEIEGLIKQGEALHQFQEEAERQSIECLPKLQLSDVPKKIINFPLTTTEKGALTLHHHCSFTNHILFADLLFDLPEMKEEELPYLQLFLSFLPNLGVGKRDYKENLNYITAYLGGLYASLQLYPQVGIPGKENELKPTFSLRGKALERNIPKLFSLFTETLASLRLDEKDRIQELLLQIHTGLENKLSQNALSYAKMLSLSSFSLASFLGETLGGIHFLLFIRKLVENLDQNLPLLAQKLEEIKDKLFHLNAPTLVLSCEVYHQLLVLAILLTIYRVCSSSFSKLLYTA